MIPESVLEKLLQSILEMETDFKAESIVSGLIGHGIPPEQIILQAKGGLKRSYRKEVSAYYSESLSYDLKEYIFLQTNREGIYDSLPENLFHRPSSNASVKTKSETIQEIKRYRAEEEQARTFFLPFEYEFNFLKTQLYRIQEDFEKNINNLKLIDIFSSHWPILKKLDTYHAYIFLRIIPLIHLLRNDFKLIPLCIQMVLGIKTSLTLFKHPVSVKLNEAFTMGDGLLGEDTIIGKIIDDGEQDVLVKIGPLSEYQLKSIAPGGKLENLLDELLDYLLGANYFIYKEYVGDQEPDRFVLDSDSLVLGISARL